MSLLSLNVVLARCRTSVSGVSCERHHYVLTIKDQTTVGLTIEEFASMAGCFSFIWEARSCH